ncbi:Gfo/Idh/MocA family protein [Paenibacillus sp. HJGM_3]|uniref:Gfo/Idh/MocA family protein n=1 Tax=Paenibacillus sp. HJGM_3 TaxID=3379816 RepID=UPI00385B2AC0
MRKLRVAVIGLGAWGQCHLEAYRSIPNVEIAAICDQRTDVLDGTGDRYPAARRIQDSSELLGASGIDLVSIVTSEQGRLPLVLQALQAGKHVLVEKPVSLQAEEARQMQEAAERHGVHIVPGHILRFDPRYAEIRAAIQAGTLGELQSLYFKRARTKGMFQLYNRTHTAYLSGVHDIDLALWYTRSRVKRVRAYGQWVTGAEHPDILWACLEFRNGVLAIVHSNWMTPDEAGLAMNDSVEVIGRLGNAQFDNRGTGLDLWDAGGRHTPDLHIHRLRNGQAQGALREQLEYIAGCIATGIAPDYVSFPDAIHGIEIAEAIVRSAAEGREIELA